MADALIYLRQFEAEREKPIGRALRRFQRNGARLDRVLQNWIDTDPLTLSDWRKLRLVLNRVGIDTLTIDDATARMFALTLLQALARKTRTRG